MLIKVEQKHIDKGQQDGCNPHRCSECPVALAIIETLGRNDVRVFHRVCEIGDVEYILPMDVVDFIGAADGNLSTLLKPFSFELEFPC